jgi:farnesyl-diphosphate farnesyltransferase
MAIATLEECFDNPRVFTGVVKIRKGLTARLLLDSGSLEGVHLWFHRLATRIAQRTPSSDPSAQKVREACAAICKITAARASAAERKAWLRTAATVAVGAAAYVALNGA